MHANAMKFLLMLDENFFGSEEKMELILKEERGRKKQTIRVKFLCNSLIL